MTITLDNGENITIYEEHTDLLRQLKPYIDKEIYEVLNNNFYHQAEYEQLEEEINDVLKERLAEIKDLKSEQKWLNNAYDRARNKICDVLGDISTGRMTEKDDIVAELKNIIDEMR